VRALTGWWCFQHKSVLFTLLSFTLRLSVWPVHSLFLLLTFGFFWKMPSFLVFSPFWITVLLTLYLKTLLNFLSIFLFFFHFSSRSKANLHLLNKKAVSNFFSLFFQLTLFFSQKLCLKANFHESSACLWNFADLIGNLLQIKSQLNHHNGRIIRLAWKTREHFLQVHCLSQLIAIHMLCPHACVQSIGAQCFFTKWLRQLLAWYA